MNRRELIDFLVPRHDHDPARVLTGRPRHTGDAGDEPVHFRPADHLAPFLEVIFDVAKGGLVRQSCDGPGAIDLALPENYFGVLVGFALVIAGEIQVDIRFLITLKAQEGFERNIEAVFGHRRAAFRTVFVRQVRPDADLCAVEPLGVLALRADVMGRQRVDLGNAAKHRDERRPDRPSGADEIAAFPRMLNQFFCNQVQNGVAVADDGFKLSVNPVSHNIRQRIAVNFLGALVDRVANFVVRPLDDRRKGAVRHRFHIPDHVRDLAGIGDHQLVGFLRIQIIKFIEHFRCGMIIQRRLMIGVFISLPGLKNGPKGRVLR